MPRQPTSLTNNFAEYTAQAADWLVLTLVSEFQVPNSDHFWPFSPAFKVNELAKNCLQKMS